MRCPFPATIAVGIVALASVAGAVPGASPGGQPTDQTKMPAAPPSTPVPAGTPADNDAAAKHVKRTACLKEAKTRKLVGDQRAAFIKECVAS